MLENNDHPKLFVLLLIFIHMVILVNSAKILSAQPSANINPSFSDFKYSEGSEDFRGHYNNSTYGIVDILIPDGWKGTEINQAPMQFSLNMNPDNRTEELSTPTMSLNVVNVPEFIKMSKTFGLVNSTESIKSYKDVDKLTLSLSSNCKVETSNSVIDGKTFEITNTKCDDKHGKFYLYEAGDKAYVIGMSKVSIGDKPDISNYFPILDETAKSLKIK